MNHTNKTSPALVTTGGVRCVLLGGLISLAAALPLHAQTSPFVNPGAETGNLNGWIIDTNGGAGWRAGVDNLAHSGTHAFSTSFEWDARHQVIDLLAAGYSATQLDAAPTITVGEWVATRTDDGGYFFLNVQLLDGNHNPLGGGTWQYGTMANPIHFPAGTPYANVCHTFSNYGPGVRYIYFGDGGKDENWWGPDNNYGPRFDDAYIAITPLVNPGAETGTMNGWIIDANGGLGWRAGVDYLAHSGTCAFSTSFEWDARHQVIDLLAAGYSAAQLDAAPTITIGEAVATRTDDGGYFFLNFQLLDGNQNPLSGGTWQYGTMDSPIHFPAGTPYTNICHTFSNYGPGVRYIYFGDGGKDENWWGPENNYGPRFDDANVTVATINTPWPGATDLGGGWKRSSWFGDFNVTYYPWIYHAQHGWMYNFGVDSSSIWFWTSDLGFLWTCSDVYCWLWSDKEQTWLYYSKGSKSPRWFYNWKAQSWERH